MSGNTRKIVDAAVESAEEFVDTTAEIGSTVVGDDGVERVLIAKDWLVDMEARLAKAERSTVAKVKEAVVSHKRQLVLAGSTVLALGAAAYVVTHKDEIIDAVEHTTEAAAETVELGAQDVKKDARKARTGSTTK